MSSLGKGNQGRGSQGRGSGDSKKLQSFRRHASGVSSALWPADMRRSLATGRVAQRRRSLVSSGKRRVLPAATLRTGSSLALMVISMFVGGTIVAALILRLEYLLLIPSAILTLTTLLIIPPLLLKPHRMVRRASLQRSTTRDLRGQSFPPMKRRSPETPLPAAPLVRVLETVDLSQSDVDYCPALASIEECTVSELALHRNIEQIEAQ